MRKIEIEKPKLEAAFAVACGNTRTVLLALFGEDAVKPEKPDYSDYRNIKTYEDACAALGVDPINETDESLNDLITRGIIAPRHIALMKLETISRALWGKDFEPIPDAEGSKIYYFPWFYLYTQSEIDNIDDDERGALLSASASNGASAGFGCLDTDYRSSYSIAYLGFRLRQETGEKAAYFGKQFIKLWAEYLGYKFTVGDHLK
ncbi:hypothetical protein PO081_17155 [Bacteroides thetaiotaomicron]|uniref:hypothetical protein n=1 Tax=Bacteroides thetaiotaomicron TaxID=818 RepID=UPI00232D927B|nr:hypothetical protein [Bacteroides thetaiotaomicron]MDC2195012.1 hypothetical protein [Bacteroides thetaiotaomicron]